MLAEYFHRWKCLVSENRFERYAFAAMAGWSIPQRTINDRKTQSDAS
jgi:hypothetical protein